MISLCVGGTREDLFIATAKTGCSKVGRMTCRLQLFFLYKGELMDDQFKKEIVRKLRNERIYRRIVWALLIVVLIVTVLEKYSQL